MQQKINLFAPCTYPITYSLGDFDEKFKIKKVDFIADIHSAEKVWENTAKKELFQYVETGGTITVNLIYDARQATTVKLWEIGTTIQANKETYEAMKAEYISLQQVFTQEKSSLEKKYQNLIAMKSRYEKDVQYWNSQWGAPDEEYQKLEAQRAEINRLVDELNRSQTTLNKKAGELNTLAANINGLIDKLNLNVAKYNTTSRSNGEEFEEGEYVRDAQGERINVYEFGSEVKLTRLLTHELWHALGMQHVEDPEAVMYRLNQDTNSSLREADITELKKVCRLK